MENDDEVKKEVQDVKVVQEYCKIWLQVLKERAKEVQDAQAQRLASCNE
jgi:hypothetical protein